MRRAWIKRSSACTSEAGSCTQLIAHLTRRAEASAGTARLALERRIAELALSNGAFAEAFHVLERMLTTDPNSALRVLGTDGERERQH